MIEIIETLSNEYKMSKAIESLNKFGISIFNPDGTYKTLGRIIDDISEVWDKLV